MSIEPKLASFACSQNAYLHTFFAESRLNIEISDRFGKKVKPREWFLVPPGIIAEAVSRLKDGSIVSFRYDAGRAAISAI
jgi:hypothetical protein